MTDKPPGWYPSPVPGEGERYWDGRYWTGQSRPPGTSDDAAPAVPPAEERRTTEGVAERRPLRRRNLAVAVVAALLVLAGAGIAIGIWQTSDREQAADHTPPTSPVAKPSPYLAVQWSRIAHDPGVFGKRGTRTMMTSVAAGKAGLVAVGHVSTSDDRQQAAVWTSKDGEHWQRVPHSNAAFGKPSGSTWMGAVVAVGRGFVAVGGEKLDKNKGSVAAVWTSDDGRSWKRVPHNPDLGQRGAALSSMRAISVSEHGLVAVGDSLDGAAAWTSKDGRSWRKAPMGGTNRASLQAVTSGGPGYVAVGTEEPSNDEYFGAVWTSRDGSAWQRVHQDSAVFGRPRSQTRPKGGRGEQRPTGSCGRTRWRQRRSSDSRRLDVLRWPALAPGCA